MNVYVQNFQYVRVSEVVVVVSIVSKERKKGPNTAISTTHTPFLTAHQARINGAREGKKIRTNTTLPPRTHTHVCTRAHKKRRAAPCNAQSSRDAVAESVVKAGIHVTATG